MYIESHYASVISTSPGSPSRYRPIACPRLLCDLFTAVLCVSPDLERAFFINGPDSTPEAGVAVPDARADTSSKLPSPSN